MACPTVPPMPGLSLPSPRRVVRQGLRVCRYLGYTDAEALALIRVIAMSAADDVLSLGGYDVSWINAIRDEAQCQLERQRNRHK